MYLLASSGIKLNANTWDLSDTLALIGILVSAIGFAIAIGQIRKTKAAAIAAKEAVELTERTLVKNRLLTVIPQFTPLNVDLEDSAVRSERSLAIRTLLSLSRLSSQTSALVDLGIDDGQLLVISLQSFSQQAATVKGYLVNHSTANVSRQTEAVRESLSNLILEMSRLEITMSVKSGDH
ncbi:MAG TPA: hypothetical protein VII67_03945 [Acidimicrobiales bacterium]